MSNKNKDDMLVQEKQYRAVITRVKGGWKASVQVRLGINEWKKVRCGLKGLVFSSNTAAENVAMLKMKEQISLDKNDKDESYVIYPK
jgi:hypothetical protein